MTEETADRYALTAAVMVIAVLTGSGFWLSYAHLAEVAARHGLDSSPIRQWAWPATLDAFIVAGELLMFRAGLRRVTDWWAIGVTATGSIGSIALNVLGVSGATSGPVPHLDYVVAAVPPTASMLAFGVLMRQIHQRVARPLPNEEQVQATEERVLPQASGPGPNPDHEPGPEAEPGPDPEPGPTPDHHPNPDHEPGPETEPGPDPEPGPTPKPVRRRTRNGPARPGTVRARVQASRQSRSGPKRLSHEQVVELVLPYVPDVLKEEGNAQITRAQLRKIMRSHEIPLSNEHLTPVLALVRAAATPVTSSKGAAR
ncbi:DUF2637 domain-containing protein [Streptomyces sp. NPDC056362]|uniref:DUF2637 domain-containing protein n=1 Tax=unclassified Streptomyces TaxID=2593676 RepID=UPI0035E01A74